MCNSEKKYQAQTFFVHRKVAGADVLISIGANVANFNGYITLNPTASFLWDALATPKTAGELTERLTDEFEVSGDIARRDVACFLEMLLKNSMVTVYEQA